MQIQKLKDVYYHCYYTGFNDTFRKCQWLILFEQKLFLRD